MKSLLKITTCAVALAAAVGTAAPKYPFPQNMKNPHGYTVPFADTDMIKAHFKQWMGAFYDDSRGWIYSPDGTGSTVSEGIAYGMLIFVYMSDAQNDYKSQFDKLYGTWKSNASNGGGMNWRVGEGSQGGTASDADFDAALALVMAAKQWGDDSYMQAATSLISWIASNDIKNGSQVKPGNQWDDGFNPSYGALASFELFKAVDPSGPWGNVLTTTASDMSQCQNSKTGLVTDWCDWNSHQPMINQAAAVGDGKTMAAFFDDAARTPWRTAWAYYWYGNNDAKKFNQKIVNWLYSATFNDAGGIMSGYKADGSDPNIKARQFVSSTFSGGLGLAASSFDGEADKAYMETVYKTLAAMTSCKSASNCGQEGVPGEKYYPATLNILYLLLMTGNMPNFYNMAGFEKFTPDPSLMRGVRMPSGIQQAKEDTTVGLSGFWKWGAYHDKWPNTGTEMKPDSGTSPLFLGSEGISAEAYMEIGPEPADGSADAQAGHYPCAGISMNFNAEETGVDFLALGIDGVRFKIKTEGTVRFAILNTSTSEAGGEPGYMLETTNGYETIKLKLAGGGSTTVGDLTVPTWVNDPSTANDVMKTVSGVKFEAKMPKGGYASISLKSIEFLKGSQVIDPVTLTGIKIEEVKPQSSSSTVVTSSGSVAGSSNSVGPDQSSSSVIGLAMADALSTIKVATSGLSVQILNAKLGANYAIMSVQGKVIASGKITSASHAVTLPNKGMYLVKVGSEIRPVSVK